jgi:methylphosphotriester-DNA--protein-cysteine methyltransferase
MHSSNRQSKRSYRGNDVLKQIIDMNLTKSALAKRLGTSPRNLDTKCKEVFGMTFDDYKANERARRNEELSKRTIKSPRPFNYRSNILGGFR